MIRIQTQHFRYVNGVMAVMAVVSQDPSPESKHVFCTLKFHTGNQTSP